MNDLELYDVQEILSDIPFEKLERCKSLIVGATGALGRYIVHTFMTLYQQKNDFEAKVVVLSRNKKKAEKCFQEYLPDERFSIIEGCAEKPLSGQESFDYIIHAGCISATKSFSSNPVEIISANTVGTYNLLELARKSASKGFIFFSSCAVNGFPLTDYYSYEGIDPAVCQNCYSLSKKQGENLCVAYHNEYGVSAKIIRIGYTYGPYVDLNDGHLYSDFLSSIVKCENLVIKGDASRYMGFCYVTDTIRGILKVLLDGIPGVSYVVRNQTEIKTIEEIAKELTQEVFAERNLKYICNKKSGDIYQKPNKPIMPQLLMDMGWEPCVSLAEGFRRSVEIIEKNLSM